MYWPYSNVVVWKNSHTFFDTLSTGSVSKSEGLLTPPTTGVHCQWHYVTSRLGHRRPRSFCLIHWNPCHHVRRGPDRTVPEGSCVGVLAERPPASNHPRWRSDLRSEYFCPTWSGPTHPCLPVEAQTLRSGHRASPLNVGQEFLSHRIQANHRAVALYQQVWGGWLHSNRPLNMKHIFFSFLPVCRVYCFLPYGSWDLPYLNTGFLRAGIFACFVHSCISSIW